MRAFNTCHNLAHHRNLHSVVTYNLLNQVTMSGVQDANTTIPRIKNLLGNQTQSSRMYG